MSELVKQRDGKLSDGRRSSNRSDGRRSSNRSDRSSRLSGSRRSGSRRSGSRRTSAVRRFTQKRARKTIGTFMKKTEHKRKSKFLQSICSDSGVCIAFGNERSKILDFFKGFTDFDYLTNTRTIGSESANGFVKEFEYEREAYKAYAVLKSSLEKDSDNLLYEYVVGQVINKYFMKRFPCFVETYGHYKYSYNKRDMFRNAGPGKPDMNKILIPYDANYIPIDTSCESSNDMCILIQHIKGASSIGDKAYNTLSGQGKYNNPKKDINFITNDLLYSLFQVYFPLSHLKDNYTHYDLHGDNVILYKPVDGKYIQYHYHYLNGEVVTFKSQFISKIIDYGRSYFNVSPHEIHPRMKSSSDYDELLCETPECNNTNEECGDESGYGWMGGPHSDDRYHISTSLRNMSHDLRLLAMLNKDWDRTNFQSNRAYVNLQTMLAKVFYEFEFGTPEVVKNKKTSIIFNVTDAEIAMKLLINNPAQIKANNDYYSKMSKLGDLHIYLDKPMNYK